MHNHGDKYPARPGLEPGTPRLQAPVDTNEFGKQFKSVLILHYEHLPILDTLFIDLILSLYNQHYL